MPRNVTAALAPPPGGATVRMYRIGHGDCFLIAFPGKNKTIHMLVDCGYKPGSPGHIVPPTKPSDVAKSILAVTGSRLDIAVLTHEHQDHVNNISDKTFADVSIGQTWVGWTDDPNDLLAEQLRDRYRDRLSGLIAAHRRMGAVRGRNIERFLGFEIGGTEEKTDLHFDDFTKAPEGGRWTNKRSMKYFKDQANVTRFLHPGECFAIPDASGVTVYVLGPPRDPDALKDLNPHGDEVFGTASHTSSPINYFAEAVQDGGGTPPFADKFTLGWDEAFDEDQDSKFFVRHYGKKAKDGGEWRRIDEDWLTSAEQLAIDMNDETNNSSLVLAIELSPGGKVLLFAGDAQAGNWRSWVRYKWRSPDGRKVDARSLLARTVLYKVGHHCSHNATLKGGPESLMPSLGWMATEPRARAEFTAMVTAVAAWAKTQDGWNHPMPAIKDALTLKAAGRVLQTDTLPAEHTVVFDDRLTACELYFDLKILP